MKKHTLLLAILLAAGFTSSRGQDTWTQKADFGGTARFNAVGFSIGTKGYIGTGNDTHGNLFNDFWEYDPATDAWTQKADFGGPERGNAVGFSIGTKGYIGTGFSFLIFSDLKDFWEYDPATNAWTQKADFGGAARDRAVGFSIGTKGYIGTGGLQEFPDFSDFWEYDPATNAWTQKADFGGTARMSPVGFSIGTKGYIGTGEQVGFAAAKDFWEYDPDTNAWTQKADFGGGAREIVVGFSIGTEGYLGNGVTGGDDVNDFWEYDPATNAWTQKANLPGPGRGGAVGFSIDSKGYIGTGAAGVSLKTFFEYTPDAGGGLTLTSAASRKTQGGQTFDINLPLSGTSGVEPRGGANEFIIFTFSNNVTAVDSTTSSCGTVVRTTIDGDAHNVTVQTNGACNQQDVIVTLNGIHDDQGNTLTSGAVTVGILYGDVNSDRRITLADQDQIKVHRGQTVDESNFLNDINRSGVIDANDLLAVRQQRGNRLP